MIKLSNNDYKKKYIKYKQKYIQLKNNYVSFGGGECDMFIGSTYLSSRGYKTYINLFDIENVSLPTEIIDDSLLTILLKNGKSIQYKLKKIYEHPQTKQKVFKCDNIKNNYDNLILKLSPNSELDDSRYALRLNTNPQKCNWMYVNSFVIDDKKILMEYMEGDLSEITLSPRQIIMLMHNLMCIYKCFKDEYQLKYEDLKRANILYLIDSRENIKIKLGDLGGFGGLGEIGTTFVGIRNITKTDKTLVLIGLVILSFFVPQENLLKNTNNKSIENYIKYIEKNYSDLKLGNHRGLRSSDKIEFSHFPFKEKIITIIRSIIFDNTYTFDMAYEEINGLNRNIIDITTTNDSYIDKEFTRNTDNLFDSASLNQFIRFRDTIRNNNVDCNYGSKLSQEPVLIYLLKNQKYSRDFNQQNQIEFLEEIKNHYASNSFNYDNIENKNIFCVDCEVENGLMLSVKKRRTILIEYFLSNDIDRTYINKKNNNGCTALNLCVISGMDEEHKLEICQMLIGAGANINIPANLEYSGSVEKYPIHEALGRFNFLLAKLFIENKADLNVKNSNNISALDRIKNLKSQGEQDENFLILYQMLKLV